MRDEKTSSSEGEHYRGEAGREYLKVRKARLHPAAQRESARLFANRVSSGDVVIDFGCGTGGILRCLRVGRKIGIEVNEGAVAVAREAGIEVFDAVTALPNDLVADVIITHHALEHVPDPLGILRGLRAHLRAEGRLVVVVPAEPVPHRRTRQWQPNPDRHLYSWHPMTLGNLVDAAGFQIEESFLCPAGYTRYLEWSRAVPPLMRALMFVYALLRGRYNTVVVARRSAGD